MHCYKFVCSAAIKTARNWNYTLVPNNDHCIAKVRSGLIYTLHPLAHGYTFFKSIFNPL